MECPHFILASRARWRKVFWIDFLEAKQKHYIETNLGLGVYLFFRFWQRCFLLFEHIFFASHQTREESWRDCITSRTHTLFFAAKPDVLWTGYPKGLDCKFSVLRQRWKHLGCGLIRFLLFEKMTWLPGVTEPASRWAVEHARDLWNFGGWNCDSGDWMVLTVCFEPWNRQGWCSMRSKACVFQGSPLTRTVLLSQAWA